MESDKYRAYKRNAVSNEKYREEYDRIFMKLTCPDNITIANFTPPTELHIGDKIVLSLLTGEITLKDGVSVSEASKEFWDALALYVGGLRCARCGKAIEGEDSKKVETELHDSFYDVWGE